MAKKQIIKGTKLRLLEETAIIHSQLLSIESLIKAMNEELVTLRVQMHELRDERNANIRKAIHLGVPGQQIGERLGITKVAIHLIKNET